MKIFSAEVGDNVANRKLGWIGHVLRMDNTRICTTLSWHPKGRRKVGRTKQHDEGQLSKNEQSLVGKARRRQEQ